MQEGLYKKPTMSSWYPITWFDYREENAVERSNNKSPEFLAFAQTWEKLIDLTKDPHPDAQTVLSQLEEAPVSYSYGFAGGPGEAFRLILPQFESFVKGQKGVVIGTEHPWVEYEVLRAGASHVSTAEYLDLSTVIPKDHPYMSYVPANTLLDDQGNGNEFADNSSPDKGPGVGVYDFAVSFSSLEHSGLGRYGDPLNPDGDLFDMHTMSCIVKPGGLAFIGIPIGGDCMMFNLHRYYGAKRLQLMFECWRVVHVQNMHMGGCKEPTDGTLNGGVPDSSNQPWFVLQNLRGCAV
eukprot:GHVQ01029901.1.p1 GENE.GHVQ01029901.1~~GHVQ01029901.1.p1  ORF type:complete len:294 (-),score=28.91 GHVQ01029901.1:342-1223(-)